MRTMLMGLILALVWMPTAAVGAKPCDIASGAVLLTMIEQVCKGYKPTKLGKTARMAVLFSPDAMACVEKKRKEHALDIQRAAAAGVLPIWCQKTVDGLNTGGEPLMTKQ